MRLRLSATALLVVLALSGCGGATSGVVTDKEHRDAYNTTTFVRSGNVQIPVVQHHPECWRINFTDGDKTGAACVSKEEWDGIEPGDHYPSTDG